MSCAITIWRIKSDRSSSRHLTDGSSRSLVYLKRKKSEHINEYSSSTYQLVVILMAFFSFHTWESWCLLLQLRACCRLCTTPPFFSDLGFWKRREKKKKMKCRWEKMCLRSIRLTEYVLMLATRTCDDRKQLNFWSFVQLAKLLKYDISSFLFRENRKRQFRATINTILDIFFSCVPKSYTKE